jgi:hypothetical protein
MMKKLAFIVVTMFLALPAMAAKTVCHDGDYELNTDLNPGDKTFQYSVTQFSGAVAISTDTASFKSKNGNDSDYTQSDRLFARVSFDQNNKMATVSFYADDLEYLIYDRCTSQP